MAVNADERMAALEANVIDLRSHLDRYAVDIETTRRGSMRLISERTAELEKNAELAHAKIHELYEVANASIGLLTGRVGVLEAKDSEGQFGYPGSSKSLVPAKHMVPSKLSKVEEWKRWKVDLEDYAEACLRHLKGALQAVKSEEGDYDANWFEGHGLPPSMAI